MSEIIILNDEGKPLEKENMYLDEKTGNLYKNGEIINHFNYRDNDIFIVNTTKVLFPNNIINIHPSIKYMRIIWDKESVLLTVMPCKYLIKDKKI